MLLCFDGVLLWVYGVLLCAIVFYCVVLLCYYIYVVLYCVLLCVFVVFYNVLLVNPVNS